MQTTTRHWQDLRRHLLRGLAGVALAALGVLLMAEPLLGVLLHPLHSLNPAPTVQTLTPTELLFAYLRLAGWGGLLLGLPWLLWQLWLFLKPGLYPTERRRLGGLLLAAPGLVYGGALFAFTVMLPVMLAYLLGFTQPGVTQALHLAAYLGFVTKLTLGVGLAFLLPLLLLALMQARLLTPAQLAAARKWVILGVFILAAILTPPDPFSQTLLALPLLLLYELALQLGKYLVPPIEKTPAQG